VHGGSTRAAAKLPVLVAVVLALSLFVGCTVPRPPGEGTIRYRDQVFASVGVTQDLTYGTAPDGQGNPVDLKLDLYQPTGDTVSKRPALIWVHGGGYVAGDKSNAAAEATYFARRGYVGVAINYRLLAPAPCGGTPSPSPECVAAAYAAQHDAQAAVRWLRANAATYRIDTSRIAMGGQSAGAITSLLVGWRPEDPGTSGNPGFSSAIPAAVSVSGGTPTNQFIEAGDASALFFHGSEDHTVPYIWAVQNAVAMYNAGILTVLEEFQGAGHNLGQTDLIREQSDYFLYFAMDLAHAQQ